MNNLLKKVLILGCSTMVILNSTGCGKEKEKAKEQEKQENITKEENIVASEKKDVAKKDFMISTEYIPVDYRSNALIVQRSEEMELYGVLDDNGDVILEPEYDRLWFKEMNGEYYIAAYMGDDFGIFDINGKEYIPVGEYDKIVTAGDIGWLAQKDDRQVLLDEDGKIKKELSGIYTCVCGNNYLFEAYMGTSMQDANALLSNGDIYDLNEKLLFKGEDIGLNHFVNVHDKDIIEVVTEELVVCVVDSKGKLVLSLGEWGVGKDNGAGIYEMDRDNNELIAYSHSNEGYPYYRYNLKTGEQIPLEIPEGKLLDWDSQVVIKKAGDFYQFYNLNGEEIIEGRYADYDQEDDVIYLENIDSQWGIIDYNGKVIVPFGELEERDGDHFYQGKKVEDISGIPGDGMYGFYTKNEDVYEFYSFQVNK